MRLAWGHGLAGLALAAGGIAVFAACQHNDSSFFVKNVLYPTPAAAGQSCSFTSDPSQAFISNGVLDIGLTTEYGAEFLLGNQLISQSNSQQLKTETSIITVQKAVVRVTDAAGNQLDTFTSLTSGTVYQASGSVPGYAPIGAIIVSQKAAHAAAGLIPASGGTATIVTYTKFEGQTLGGDSIESDEFEFPIQVCSGCLVSFAGESASSCNGISLKTPNCLGAQLGTATSSSLATPCSLGQDTPVSCAACAGMFSVCDGQYPGNSIPAACQADAGAGGG